MSKWPSKTKTLREDQVEGLRRVFLSNMLEPLFDLHRELLCYSDDYPYISRELLLNVLLDFNIMGHTEEEGSELKRSSNMGS